MDWGNARNNRCLRMVPGGEKPVAGLWLAGKFQVRWESVVITALVLRE